jgi:hypothetical protein
MTRLCGTVNVNGGRALGEVDPHLVGRPRANTPARRYRDANGIARGPVEGVSVHRGGREAGRE